MRAAAIAMALLLAACSSEAAEPIAPGNAESKPITSIEELLEHIKTAEPREVKVGDVVCRGGFGHIVQTDGSLTPWTPELERELNSDNQSYPILASAKEPTLSPLNEFNCVGTQTQGGALFCRTLPSTEVLWNGIKTKADKSGLVIIGFDRDAKASPIKVTFPNGTKLTKEITFTPRDWDISRIDGLPKNQVSEYTPEELKRIRAATARKKVGFASRVDTVRLTEAGFTSPVAEYIKTTNFGAQRILNGIEKRPHYGVDMAAPAGTPITAPAGGVVSLADDDMYFEGSLIMIDHGQGLISYYLHMQDVLVEEGQIVATGDLIGTVGSKGRSTGPHLCWRLKWRGQNLDPELLTKWADK